MSVMLRTHCVRWPRSRSRRCSTSYSKKVAAWPTWPPSYGVMPHVYIVTVGPGSNGTTSCRDVSKILTTRLLDAGDADADPRLVLAVQLQQHRRHRLDGTGIGE